MDVQGLRWFPPIASELPKKVHAQGALLECMCSGVQVPPGGDVISGYFVPAGVDIG